MPSLKPQLHIAKLKQRPPKNVFKSLSLPAHSSPRLRARAGSWAHIDTILAYFPLQHDSYCLRWTGSVSESIYILCHFIFTVAY